MNVLKRMKILYWVIFKKEKHASFPIHHYPVVSK